MEVHRLFGYYFWWHYTTGIKDFWGVASNLIVFVYNFFSINVLAGSLFSPWRRLGEQYTGGFDLAELLSVWTINFLMRIVGAIFRSILIIIGLLFLVLSLVISVASFVVWLLWPFLILGLIVVGLTMFVI